MFGYLLKVGSIKRTEIARVLVRFNHVASYIVNANHSIMRTAVKLCVGNKKAASAGSRARKEIRGSLSKIIKKAASITELLTEHDQQENLRVIRQAKRATHRLYDGEQKRLIEVPDHKTRLAGVILDLSYREGLPVQRSISAHADFEDLQTLLEAMKQSPASQASLQKTVDG